VDAPPASWYLHLESQKTSVDIEKVVGALIAVMPIIGTARVVSAASNILGATELDEEIASP
jgi:hypothetical protein